MAAAAEQDAAAASLDSEMEAIFEESWWHNPQVRIEFQADNPKRANTKAFTRYEAYKTAKTVGDARSASATTSDLRNDFESGFLHICQASGEGSKAAGVSGGDAAGTSASSGNTPEAKRAKLAAVKKEMMERSLASPVAGSKSLGGSPAQPPSSARRLFGAGGATAPIPAGIGQTGTTSSAPPFTEKSAAPSGPVPPPAVTLEAIEGILDQKLDEKLLPVNTSIAKLQGDILAIKENAVTKKELADAVGPIKSEVDVLSKRMAALELRPAPSASSSAEVASLQRLVQSLEHELHSKRVLFIGWPADVPHSAREKFILQLVGEQASHMLEHRPVVGTFQKGPRNSRTNSATSFIDFGSAELATNFLTIVKDKKMEYEGHGIDVKPPRSAFQTQRNNFLRDMEKKVKASQKAEGQSVELDWKGRSIKMGNLTVFEQAKGHVSGTWHEPFLAWNSGVP